MTDTWTRRPRPDPTEPDWGFLLACLLAVVVIGGFALLAGRIIIQDARNGSTDGRQHTCNYRTEQGVTEHLDVYWARCGKSVP